MHLQTKKNAFTITLTIKGKMHLFTDKKKAFIK